MLQINKLSLTALALCATGALVACGPDADGKVSGNGGSAKAALSEADQASAEQLLFIAEGQSEGAYGVACAAIRTNLFATRQALKLGTDWSNLTGTQPHKTFSANWKTYKNAGCNAGDARSECVELRNKIAGDIGEVVKTPEWGVLINNGRFKTLVSEYSKARAIDCIAPTGL